MLILADCRPLPPISVEFELTVSPHAAFVNRRCLETPFPGLPCGSDANHVRPSRRATAFIVEGSEAQLLSYMLKTAWYGNRAQSGRDLDLASSLPELVSPFDWPRWLLPPASHTVSNRGKPPPRCPPQHPMQPNLPQNSRTRMHQPLQIFISPLSLGGPIVDEDFSPSSTQ
jgi:hypothetical protein